jgi:hypothetical protein
VCSACRISDSDRCGGRSGDAIRVRVWSWRGVSVFAGLLNDIALGRPQAARRRFLCVLCVLCIPCLLFPCLPRIPCFLFVHLYLSCCVVPLHDICRVERPDGKKGLTGLACPNGTSTASVRRSGNSLPSSFCLFCVLKNGMLTHSRKLGWVGEPLALSLLPRDSDEMRPWGGR